jgi:hypothetical protein
VRPERLGEALRRPARGRLEHRNIDNCGAARRSCQLQPGAARSRVPQHWSEVRSPPERALVPHELTEREIEANKTPPSQLSVIVRRRSWSARPDGQAFALSPLAAFGQGAGRGARAWGCGGCGCDGVSVCAVRPFLVVTSLISFEGRTRSWWQSDGEQPELKKRPTRVLAGAAAES